ncbi:head maturation protease, ClpP-related [Marinibactrum halimedae]|uniref:ATP-dependent Clp protease proteolytic subunit n=1 Tax=Marinibactrum halimedae TaxID=1444977 RepID=A0AA37WQS5_9GAMM|nr:head maturation protease, ClpP-related [Marinibactrum halimedae]MCD9458893.1 Clp protease ClpP [Marinibactrum halimedae]GLS27742.1 hypothetical protein GCM10007877_34610 [Marinibactrum halimedae]
MMSKNTFFKTENVSNEKSRYHINGVIGHWGNSTDDILWHIENNKSSELEIFIQSPGGNAFEGLAIHNALVAHSARVTTQVLGAAASAGSLIFMAGDERIMPDNTHLMIHEPTVNVNGKARELREAADFLDGLTNSLVSTYLPRASIDEEQLLHMIRAETWMNAKEAVEYGLATQRVAASGANNLGGDFNARFASLPTAQAKTPIDVDSITSLKDAESCLRESGFSKSKATTMVAKIRRLLQSDSENETAILNTLKSFNAKL